MSKKLTPKTQGAQRFYTENDKNMIKICILCVFFALFAVRNTFAQADAPLRVEFESSKDQQDYKFVSLGKQGAAVFYQSAVVSADTMQWVFLLYDTNLVRKGFYKIKLPNLCQYLAADFSNDKLYMFFQKPAFRKDTLKNYLLEWDVIKQNFQLYDLQNHKAPYLTFIRVVDNYLFIIANEIKVQSVVYYNIKTHATQTLHFPDDEVISFESFCVDTIGKKTYCSLFLKNRKNSRAELFVTNFSGSVLSRVIFPTHEDIVYNSAKVTIAGRDSVLITGAYSNTKENKQKGTFSGFYTMPFSVNKFSNIKTHFFGALFAKDSELNTKHLEASNIAMNMHINQSNGKVFAVAHLFFPEYQYHISSSYRSFGYYGYDAPMQIFSGYRFLNAYILEFNTNGILVNEWFLSLNNVLTQSLYNLVNVFQDPEGNSLIYYVYNNEVVSQFVSGQRVIAPQSSMPITLMQHSDFLESNSNISMRNWHDNTFMLYGYQHIRNSQRSKGKRYVFFLNKLVCE
jgi:hypothetical protein